MPSNLTVLELQKLIGKRPISEIIDFAEKIKLTKENREPLLKMLTYLNSQHRQFNKVISYATLYISHFPEQAFGYAMLANAYRYSHQNQKAQDTLIDAIKSGIPNANLINQLGLLQHEADMPNQALNSFNQAINLDKRLASAYKNKSLLSPFWSQNEIDELLKLSKSNNFKRAELAELYYALFNIFNSKKDYEKAFSFLHQGATHKRASLFYNHQKEIDELIRLKNIVDKNVLSQCALPSEQQIIPIFICGLPRSGTTLVEQIVSSHPLVTAGDEIDALPKSAEKILRKSQNTLPYPDWISRLSAKEYSEIRKSYLTETRYLQGTPYFTDKMLLNYKAIGLIHIAIPEAKIIHCKRQPLDNLFGCYKQLFGDGIRFSYDFKELAETYHAYADLMKHWHESIPGKILDVQYENLARQPKEEITRILRHLDLPDVDECFDFHNNKRIALTISTSQIKNPMTTSHIDSWKNYENEIAPLRAMLSKSAK